MKPILYSFLVDISEHKTTKGVNRNVVLTIRHNGYKYVLLNNKILRHLMNGIRSKHHTIGTYEINEIALSCFDDKIYTPNNWYNGLALGY